MRLRTNSYRSRYLIVLGAISIISFSILFYDSIEDMITGASGQVSIAGIGAITGALTNAIIDAINATGYLGIFGLMLLEGTSLPIPSEVVLPFAGYLVSIGRLEFWLTVGLATSAGVIGALVDYYIGMYLGMRVISDYGSRLFISQEQMRKVELLFERHGGKIVFASRLIPGVRTLASFPAGSARMNLPRFTLYTAVGCFGFDTVLVYVGDYLGVHWSTIRAIGILELAATVAVLITTVWIFFRIQRGQSSETPKPA